MRDQVLSELSAANPWALPWLERWAGAACASGDIAADLAADMAADMTADMAGAAFVVARARASWERLAAPASEWSAWAARMRDARAAAARTGGPARAAAEALAALDLRKAPPSRRVELAGRSCPGDVWIGSDSADARPLSEIWLDAAAIDGELALTGAVTGPASLQAAELRGGLSIGGARFGDRVEATKLSVAGSCCVIGASFAREAWFREAQLKGPVRFEACRFAADIGFLGARFAGPAVFAACRFDGNLGLERAQFDGPAEFHGVAGPRKAFLSGAVFARARDELAVSHLGEPLAGGANVTKLSEYRKRRLGA